MILDFEGVSVSGFSDDQKQKLVELIELFIGNMREGHAEIRMEEIVAHLDNTWSNTPTNFLQGTLHSACPVLKPGCVTYRFIVAEISSYSGDPL